VISRARSARPGWRIECLTMPNAHPGRIWLGIGASRLDSSHRARICRAHGPGPWRHHARQEAPVTPRRSRRSYGGGEGGIRTRDGLPRTAFPVRRHSPLGDLSRNRPTRPLGVSGQGAGEHVSERTQRCVSERAEPATRDWRVQWASDGGEGGIRTRGAFAHRFSRAAPSTTRTPLRGRGYQRSTGRPTGRRSPRADQAVARRSRGSRPEALRPRRAGSR
jgi:hypothetical protein